MSIPGAVSTVTRQVQTNFEPRATKRLTRSSSAVNQDPDELETGESHQQIEPEFQPIGRHRADELSQSQPEEIGGKNKSTSPPSSSSPGRHPRANRRRQLLKALSEGTILLDRKRARRFASGYVEVNVNNDERSPAEEEIVAGRVLVHDPAHRYGSSDEGSFDDDDNDLFAASSIPVRPSRDSCSDVDDPPALTGQFSSAEEPAVSSEKLPTLQAQKSYDSNASLPDTAGNYSDEFGSTSQVTVLQPNAIDKSAYVIACDSDDVDQHPPTPPPRRLPASTATESSELSETEKEIMVQFPPWPGAQELIPAPPSFASSSGSLPPPEEEEEELPPPPAQPISPSNKQMTDRVLLRHLKHGSKSMSETITSVDSDSSGRRVTEHETSASSEPLSPTSELNSPLQPDVTNNKRSTENNSADNSDAFLTALSDHLTTAGLTEVYNTAMERSYRESDTSHNSTLRMDQSGVQDLPYEEPPPPQVDDGGPLPPAPPPGPPLTSPDSNNDGPEFGRESSTSGSYSLEATPCVSSPLHEPAAASSLVVVAQESTATPSIDVADRKALKEGMKLQFPAGSSMFSSSGLSPSLATTPSRSAGRRKHYVQQTTANQPSSTDSEDNDDDRSSRKRRSNKNTSNSAAGTVADPSSSSAHDSAKRPSSKHKKARSRDATTPVADAQRNKRDSQIGAGATTPGMVRSPAMHEGFRLADWAQQQQPLPNASDDANFFTLQHPSESGSFQENNNNPEVTEGTSWNLMAPSSSHPQQNCESIRSVSPGSDNVFVSETVELSGNGVVKPPEGFADSPATLVADWNLPVASAVDSTASEGHQETKRKHRDSGRGKRTKSCTLPSSSGLSLEGSGGPGSPELSCGPHRAVSTIDMWYPETQLPPKRQLTVRAKSEERERWSRTGGCRR